MSEIKMFNDLKGQIARFRIWANAYPYLHSGEWECDYPEWGLIYDAFERFLQAEPAEKWDDEVTQDLLFIIARDNEMEILISELANDETRLLILAVAALSSSECDAKWQAADQLKNLSSHKQEAEALLLKFVEDDHEYVRRRAMAALGFIGSSQVDRLADQIWNRGVEPQELQEYQRLAVLEALHKVNSPLIKEYLIKAKQDGRKYLIAFANEIEKEWYTQTN